MGFIDTRTQFKSRRTLSIRDYPYMAKSGPEFDCAPAINQAIQDAPNGTEIFIPPGDYYIRSPIIGKTGCVLVGNKNWPSYGSSQPHNSYGPSRIIVSPIFNGTAVIDFRGHRNFTISDLVIVGDGTPSASWVQNIDATIIGIATGSYDQPDNTTTSFGLCRIENCDITLCRVGIGMKQNSYVWVRYNNIGDISGIGIDCIQFSGNDGYFEGNYINTCNRLLPNISDPINDLYIGAGFSFRQGSGGVQIIGGKIEYCATGIVLGEMSQQVRVIGTTFDANSKWNVRIRSCDTDVVHQGNPAGFRSGSPSHSFTACQFLNGGYLPQIEEAGLSAMVYMEGKSAFPHSVIEAIFTGNSFWSNNSSGPPDFASGADVFFIFWPGFPRNLVVARGDGNTTLSLAFTGNNLIWNEADVPVIDIPENNFNIKSQLVEYANLGNIILNVPKTMNVSDGQLTMNYGEFVKVSPSNEAWLTDKIIGTSFEGEDTTQIFVPGGGSKGSRMMNIFGGSESIVLGPNATYDTGTVNIKDNGVKKKTLLRIRSGDLNVAADPLVAINETGFIGADGTFAGKQLAHVGSGARILWGHGWPDTLVAAPLGSIYLNLDGGANRTIWIKEDGGIGNTGWVWK